MLIVINPFLVVGVTGTLRGSAKSFLMGAVRDTPVVGG